MKSWSFADADKLDVMMVQFVNELVVGVNADVLVAFGMVAVVDGDIVYVA